MGASYEPCPVRSVIIGRFINARSFRAIGSRFLASKENTMDGLSTKAMDVQQPHAESLVSRPSGVIWAAITLIALAIILCFLPSSLFMNSALDLAFPYP